MKIIAFDQAILKTGVAVFENDKLVNHFLIDLSKFKNEDSEKRIEKMAMKINEVVENENADVVIFEDVAFQSNAQTLIKLARLQGFIAAYCSFKKINYYIFSAQKWRCALNFETGKNCKRRFLKNQAKLFVKMNYKKNVEEDEADAICIASAYIKLFL